MTTNLTLNPKCPLQRAKQLADMARALAERGQLRKAERCRRLAFGWLQFVALTGDDQPAPNQWILEQLVAAHMACAAQHTGTDAAAGALAH